MQQHDEQNKLIMPNVIQMSQVQIVGQMGQKLAPGAQITKAPLAINNTNTAGSQLGMKPVSQSIASKQNSNLFNSSINEQNDIVQEESKEEDDMDQ